MGTTEEITTIKPTEEAATTETAEATTTESVQTTCKFKIVQYFKYYQQTSSTKPNQ